MKAKGYLLGVTALVVLVHALPIELREQGVYLVDAPKRGEHLRWLFAHFIHQSWAHLAFNVVSFGLACWVLAPVLVTGQRWAWGTGLVAVGISASLALLNPDAPAFVGLSALVYAWLVAGAVRGLSLRRFRVGYGLMIALVGGKLLLEESTGRGFGGASWLELGASANLVHQHAFCWGLFWGGTSWVFERSRPARGA